MSAVSNATKITTGILRLRLALQQQNLRAAQDFPQTQAGTQLQVLPRLGTATTGHRQMQELSIRPQAQQNADLNATNITLGRIYSALQILNLPTAPDFRQMRSGTQLQALLRLGTDMVGALQQLEAITQNRVRLNAGINAVQTTTGKIRHAFQTQRTLGA